MGWEVEETLVTYHIGEGTGPLLLSLRRVTRHKIMCVCVLTAVSVVVGWEEAGPWRRVIVAIRAAAFYWSVLSVKMTHAASAISWYML